MKRLLLSLTLGTTSLYLAIRWLPSEQPINTSYYFADLIFNPIKFFAAAVAFLFAFLFLSNVFQAVFTEIYNLFKNRKSFSLVNLLFGLMIVFVPILLMEYSVWTLYINLIIAFIYGIFTLDVGRDTSIDRDN
ncbi:hypothetical protein CIB95_07210 [Lottiidibacillus patelloidae]|uniref:Uncharacterized protein n=1 Tax=Lottiidibacillus patelloidae TaxID=2670334 RepID=A0A263BU76_9BACI|nr:hypothetical protein [Lottiidibacillus patelloidae]OZM57245.1 hypothetical protein CIB95_07210 [Lottiidibacillus patelloidae]